MMRQHNLSATLYDEPSTTNQQDLTEVQELSTSEASAKSYALRLLIHYLGDIHQPLHCATRVDKAYPEGDRGGNLFPLPNHYATDDLHAVWDSVLYNYHDKYTLVSNYYSHEFKAIQQEFLG